MVLKAGRVVFGSVAALAAMVALSGCREKERADGAPLPTVAKFGEVGVNPGQFTYPRALTNDGQSLWVIDKSARVQRLDPGTGESSALWTMPDWAMGKPCGVSIGPDGLLYIPDTHYFRVMVYRRDAGIRKPPELVASFGSLGEGPGQFMYLTDVAFLPAPDGTGIERMYVGEYGGNDRISVFDGTYRFLFSFGVNGEPDDESKIHFSRPQSIEVDADRRLLVVTDACHHRVGVFDVDGHLVRWIGRPGSGAGQLAYPYGVALLGDGTAMVTEFGNHRVSHVDYETGTILGTYGRPGRGPGELTNPWAVTVLDGKVFVLDSGNDRVQAFAAPKPIRREADVRAADGSGRGGPR